MYTEARSIYRLSTSPYSRYIQLKCLWDRVIDVYSRLRDHILYCEIYDSWSEKIVDAVENQGRRHPYIELFRAEYRQRLAQYPQVEKHTSPLKI